MAHPVCVRFVRLQDDCLCSFIEEDIVIDYSSPALPLAPQQRPSVSAAAAAATARPSGRFVLSDLQEALLQQKFKGADATVLDKSEVPPRSLAWSPARCLLVRLSCRNAVAAVAAVA